MNSAKHLSCVNFITHVYHLFGSVYRATAVHTYQTGSSSSLVIFPKNYWYVLQWIHVRTCVLKFTLIFSLSFCVTVPFSNTVTLYLFTSRSALCRSQSSYPYSNVSKSELDYLFSTTESDNFYFGITSHVSLTAVTVTPVRDCVCAQTKK